MEHILDRKRSVGRIEVERKQSGRGGFIPHNHSSVPIEHSLQGFGTAGSYVSTSEDMLQGVHDFGREKSRDRLMQRETLSFLERERG